MNAKKIYILSLTCLLLIIFSIGGVFISWRIEQRNKKVMLVVAKHDYPKGTIITDPEQMFELREFLEVDAPFDNFSKVEEAFRGLMLTRDIHKGDPLQHVDVSVAVTLTGLIKEGKLEPPGPGRKYLPITTAQAREDSIRVGSRVDVIESQSTEDPKGESKIVLHNVLVRAVLPEPGGLQKMLDMEGKRNLVALRVLVETSTEEFQAFYASVKKFGPVIFFEVRPSVDNKKTVEKNSPKVP